MPRRGGTNLVLAAGAAAGSAWLGACSNPLGSIDADYGKRLEPARLRSIEQFRAERYAAPAPAEADPKPRLDIKRFEGEATASVTIEEARAATLANNLDLKVALVNPSISAAALREEEAKFESVFRPSVFYAENDAPTLDRTATNSQDTVRVGAGVSIPLRTGGRASVDFSESYQQTDNPFFTLNSAYAPSIDLQLSQPLLRGAGRRANTYSIRIASYNQQLAEAATKLEVIRKLADVDRAYWVLDALRRELEVTQRQYELSVEQRDRAQRLIDAGQTAEIEVVRAEDAVAGSLENIIIAENAVLQQQRLLKRLMNKPDLPVESKTLVAPTTAPEIAPYVFDRAALTQAAIDNRTEMLELELQLAADFSAIEFAKNQALPSFILDYRYSIDGLGGSHASAAQLLARNEFESWSIGVSGEIPLGNQAAKSRVHQAILQRLQRLSSREAREQAIVQEVLSAVDQVEAGWQRILAARQAVITATRAYAAEKRQFDLGANTSIDLLNATTRLAEAQSREIRAMADYQIARVDLAFATGTLLGASRVDWSPIDRAEEPEADPTPPAFPLYADPDNVKPPSPEAMEDRRE